MTPLVGATLFCRCHVVDLGQGIGLPGGGVIVELLQRLLHDACTQIKHNIPRLILQGLAHPTGPAILAVSKGPRSQFKYCLWSRSSHGTDFDIAGVASPVLRIDA